MREERSEEGVLVLHKVFPILIKSCYLEHIYHIMNIRFIQSIRKNRASEVRVALEVEVVSAQDLIDLTGLTSIFPKITKRISFSLTIRVTSKLNYELVTFSCFCIIFHEGEKANLVPSKS